MGDYFLFTVFKHSWEVLHHATIVTIHCWAESMEFFWSSTLRTDFSITMGYHRRNKGKSHLKFWLVSWHKAPGPVVICGCKLIQIGTLSPCTLIFYNYFQIRFFCWEEICLSICLGIFLWNKIAFSDNYQSNCVISMTSFTLQSAFSDKIENWRSSSITFPCAPKHWKLGECYRGQGNTD